MIFSPPSQLHHSSFNHGGQGAAMCQTVDSDERSYLFFTSSGKREIRDIIVGTNKIQSALCLSTAANVASASNCGKRTKWLPWNNEPAPNENGALWYSGPGMHTTPSTRWPMPGAPTLTMPGSPATINLGRPVEPPDVGAFIAGEVTSGKGESS